jgi:hypothetical protein
MNKEGILNLFFNDILPSIARNDLRIEDAIYNIRFNAAIYNDSNVKYIANIHNPDLPTLTIKNIDLFSHHLINYINEVMASDLTCCKPYIDVSTEESKIKYFLSLMWVNMTSNDFLDPVAYLKRYTSFLQDRTFENLKTTSEPIEKLDGCHLEILNIEEKACYETTYAMRVLICDPANENNFVLPDVKYGIEDDNGIKKAYIYAIQYDHKMRDTSANNKKFTSKINRLLYKVNQDIPQEELDKKMGTQETDAFADENIIDVTPSSLVSLTVTLSLLASEGIKKIVVPSYLPLRWDAKSVMYERKIERFKEAGYDEAKLDAIANEFRKDQLHIQRNVTDKLLRNFRRLEYHFDGINVTAYPQDVDDNMHVDIDPNFHAHNDNHLLNNIVSTINYKNNHKIK